MFLVATLLPSDNMLCEAPKLNGVHTNTNTIIAQTTVHFAKHFVLHLKILCLYF